MVMQFCIKRRYRFSHRRLGINPVSSNISISDMLKASELKWLTCKFEHTSKHCCPVHKISLLKHIYFEIVVKQNCCSVCLAYFTNLVACERDVTYHALKLVTDSSISK